MTNYQPYQGLKPAFFSEITTLISVANCQNANMVNERAVGLNITHTAITGSV